MEEERLQSALVPSQSADTRQNSASPREGSDVRGAPGTGESPDSGADRGAPETGSEGSGRTGSPAPPGLPDAGQKSDPGLKVFPVIRRVFPPQSILSPPPLRRGIDYQSTARKSLLFIFCDECGGVVDTPDAHKEDLDACDLEKVRQVMEW